MKVSLKWLRDYVDINKDVKTFADMMTMSGTKSEAIEFLGEEIENVVTGKIVSIEEHPDAEKLIVTQIDIGKEELLQIVTGAKNVSVGDYVPVALHGSKLPGGIKIKNGKLRGVASNGMLCSNEELNIDSKYIDEKSKDGILLLHEVETGKDIREVLLLNDAIVEFELTANRPDCQSMMGIAYEAAATLGIKANIPVPEVKAETDADVRISVDVEDECLCPRYMLREIRDIKICPSPYWMQRRLIEYGMRPINNIVDITNYVMIEYGQPLHAFDAEKIQSGKILVRRAHEGEKLTTLDAIQRTLDTDMLLITDGKQPIGIAGVMGGFNTEIDANTKNIVIESALFDADSIRLTSRRLGLRSEASSKYEKGIDILRPNLALDRACQLIEELGYGSVCSGIVDTMKTEFVPAIIQTTFSNINGLMGTELSISDITDILQSLNFECLVEGDNIKVTVPHYRLDMAIADDIVEEVARIYGYNNIESKPIYAEVTQARKSKDRQFEDILKSLAMNNGLTEVSTYSFVSPKGLEKSNITDMKYHNFLKLLNPLGEETSVMRTSLIPEMLDVMYTNTSRKNDEFAAFEYGNTFFMSEEDKLPEEAKAMVAAAYGKAEEFFIMKARLEGILKGLGLKEYEYVPEKTNRVFHPGRCANVVADGKNIAVIGEIHPAVLENYGIKKRIYLFEIFVDEVKSVSNTEIIYSQIPKYPTVLRDIALVVDKDVYVNEIEKVIRKNGKKLLEEVKLFDIFEGAQIGSDKKSVAYSLKFRAADRTLTDEEINPVIEKILLQLEIECNANLR
ncbi:phenylalanine--tRNA ligase subunit beta [Proteocatella sphenisci]|uniref:phenylalanine--tRNA ligase subunit beta n=1 Tax=Proteocatella sphenisci TaxID=181070 RepID=UPI00048A8348|nr:phenylalanine--tRNA ligase subunit beta [Proteocatella sphenisci]